MENNENLLPAENPEFTEPPKAAKKPSNKRNWVYRGLMAIFAVIFLVSAGFLVDYYIESTRQRNQYDDLSNLVNQNRPTIAPTQPTDPVTPSTPVAPSTPVDPSAPIDPSDPVVDPTKPTEPPKPTYSVLPDVLVTIKHPVTGKDMQILQEYAPIFQLNTDLVGWLSVSGTKVNYPVLQTPNDPHYYLYRDFYKNDAKHGAIYANSTADIDKPSDNITIYGHRMNDGSMFRTLLNFKDKEFYEKNRYIYFDTLTEHHVYEIISVFQTNAVPGEGFVYHTFVDGTEAKFNRYVSKCKELSWHDTDATAEYGDKLITLSTCDHSVYQGRWVVVAKRIA